LPINMKEYINQPREDDAVLGNQSLTSVGDAVLGGIAGVQWRLDLALSNNPESLEAKITALYEAANYREDGLHLLIQALEDDSWQIHQTAYSLLEQYATTQVESALANYKRILGNKLLKCYEGGDRNFKKANLSRLFLQWADLSEANFSEANLSGAYLNRADLISADLSHTNLRRVDLSQANLTGVNLSQAMMSWANVSEANLSQANLSGANLVNTNLMGSDLNEANFAGAKLKGVNLTNTNLTNAYYNDETDFPIGFKDYDQMIKLPSCLP
ncbi:MAG TPA: hypothetical protein DCY91_02030, partial [Cyanobacteria bacterium UBA11370]|nr:hypothetical protein [Cyanobacteria bacterium UBA11370]